MEALMGERERSQARDICEPALSRRAQQLNRAAELDEQWRWPTSERTVCRKIVTSLPLTYCRLETGHIGPCEGKRGQ